MAPIIRVEQVGKRYSRKAQQHRAYGIADLWREVLGRQTEIVLRKDEFWAVDDLSFTMEPGESLALIGRNGAGKSTLLKLMHGIAKPDRGRIVMEGQVQALINLGAGFNGELSGLENIYNAASLAGLGAREIRGIADEVVAFSELEEAIESPTGTYSSGMKARLGFSVAVHLKPDILLIDEVLAVGDFAFQNKCFLRMEQLKRSGVTIVYVSHSHNMAIKLCERALWLHRGKVMATGSSMETVQAYLTFLEEEERAKNPAVQPRPNVEEDAPMSAAPADLYGPITSALDHVHEIDCTLYVKGEPTTAISVHSEVIICFGFTLKRRVEGLSVTLNFFREDGLLMGIVTSLYESSLEHLHEGRVACEVRIPDLDFAPGAYAIVMPISEGQGYLWRDVVARFHVTGGGKIAAGVKHIAHEFRVLGWPPPRREP